MTKFMLKAYKSATTANVLAAGGSAAGVLAFLRSMWPELLPWGPELDTGLVAVLAAVFGRLIAVVRKPEKADGLVAVTPPLNS